MNSFNIKVALFLILSVASGKLAAQLRTAPDPTLETPYNTIYVHLYYLQSDSYEPEIAARTIQPLVDSSRAVSIAVKIKQLYDGKGLYVPLSQLPEDPDYRDTVTNKPYYTPFPSALPEVYLEKVDGRWYYSQETMALVPGLHKRLYPLGSDILVRILPHKADVEILGLALWQYLGIAIIIALSVIVYFVLFWITKAIFRKLIRTRESWQDIEKKDVVKMSRLASMFLALFIARWFLPAVQLPIRGTEIAYDILGVFGAMLFIWLGLAIINVVTHHAEQVAERTDNRMDDQLLPIMRRGVQIVIWILGIIYVLDLLDVNVTALIAGVSIGGLALALAAQDTVKNMIGSAVIFIDKPFQVGDYVIAGGQEGTITEVGFRSTRIMQIDTSIIAIPNGTIANMPITNLGVRESRLMNITIGVIYQTSPDLLEDFLVALRQLVQDHPHTRNEPAYVHFRELADSSVNIMFRCYLDVPGYPEELQAKEDILFRIVRIAEKLGVEFAYPTQTLFLENLGKAEE